MVRPLMMWVVLLGICVTAGSAAVETPDALPVALEDDSKAVSRDAAWPAMDAIWAEPGVSNPNVGVALEVRPELGRAPAEPVVFNCAIRSTSPYEATMLGMRVTDSLGAVLTEGLITLNMHEGLNIATFEWEVSGLPLGAYEAVFAADFTAEFDAATCVIPLRRVSSDGFRGMLLAAESKLSQLGECVAGFEQSGTPAPYLRLRLGIAKDFAGKAWREAALGSWQALNTKVAYLTECAASVEAQLAFSGLTPERFSSLAAPALTALDKRDGAFWSKGRPVFLFGRVVDIEAPAQITALPGFGLNFAVLPVHMEHVVPDAWTTQDVSPLLERSFHAAEAASVSTAVQLMPDRLAGWTLDAWPGLTDVGFVNLSHEGVREAYEKMIDAVLPAISEQPTLALASLAQGPRFRFDGPEVRAAFIEQVQGLYPDRQELNRAWHAHLSLYDDISIWGEYPDYSYQNRTTYQFDWQAFHRGLMAGYLDEIEGRARALAAGVPLGLTVSDGIFELGETRTGFSRERVAECMDVTACSVSQRAGDSMFGMGYTHLSATYALLRSFAEEQPVVDVWHRLDLGGETEPERVRQVVRSTLIDSVVSGLNGMALEPASMVFERPAAAEALALAALDVNRLAPVFHAFQVAEPEVGILFSEVSKIMKDGERHLLSAYYAYEGCSFAGYGVRFITEGQVRDGVLKDIKVLVMPETPAIQDDVFELLVAYVDGGGTVARVGTPIPYNERGQSRHDVIRNTGRTVLVRGMNLPTEYLHAMDAAIVFQSLPPIPRPVNAHGYPLEGVKTRYVEHDGHRYLYLVNLRKGPVDCYLAGNLQSGRDLLLGRSVSFPRTVAPLDPMVILLDEESHTLSVTATPAAVAQAPVPE